MVYINHIYANVTASDDSQANVYAMVVPSATNTANGSIINYIVTNVATNAESSGVYRLTQDGLDGGMGIPFGQLDTVVQKNLFKQYVSPEGVVSRILKGIDYKVCFLAIDEYANRSGLEVSVSGNIVDRPAPVHTTGPSYNVNVLTNTGLSNITTSLYMSSDMYFEYYAAMFAVGAVPSANDFISFITSNSSNPHVAYGNVTSANSAQLYDALLVKPLLNSSTVFTRAFTNISDATLYELAADKTSDRYLGVFMRNMDPYGEHVATRVVFTYIPKTVTSTYTLTLVTTTVFDRSANVAFNLNTWSGNETIYYKTFNNVQTVNGTFIDDLFANPQDSFSPQTVTDVKRILQFWNGSGYENMVFGNTYYVYARVRHNQTGQMSTSSVSFQTGAEPLLQGIIAQTRTTASTVDFTNTVVVDQSNVDIYIGVTSNAYDDSNVIKHLTNNPALNDTTNNYNQLTVPKEGVLKFSARVPNTYGLFTLSTSVIDKYYSNIVDNTTSLITGAGGQNVYMYVVDENQLGNVFSTVLATIPGYSANEISAQLTMDETFDRSFLVKTPNANIDAVHYIMAFSNIQEPPVDFWTETSMYTKFVANANVSTDRINAVSIIDYFDPTIDTRNTIIPGGTYNIYTVALDTINNETYHDSTISILRDVVAVQPPVISLFTVDFNT